MKPSDCEPQYRDGRHYDLQNARLVEDIPFFVTQAKRLGGPVLELDALLHYNGLTAEAKYGDYAGTPFGPGSAKQVVVCRA